MGVGIQIFAAATICLGIAVVMLILLYDQQALIVQASDTSSFGISLKEKKKNSKGNDA